MKKKREIQYVDIVFLGDFNPSIFSPAWFAVHDLIGETEAETAEVQLIHSDVAVFSLSWCRVQITRERFSILTEQEAYFQFLFDLVIGTFQLLSHTPIRALGLNRGTHVKLDSEKQWHAFGHFLVPNAPWENVLDDSGMLKVEVTQKHPPKDPLDGVLRIKIEPSNRLDPGVLFNINKHFETQNPKETGCKEIVGKLKEQWQDFNIQAENAVDRILTNFGKRGSNE